MQFLGRLKRKKKRYDQMELLIILEEKDATTISKLAEIKHQRKEDIAKAMLETMIIWLKEQHPDDLS